MRSRESLRDDGDAGCYVVRKSISETTISVSVTGELLLLWEAGEMYTVMKLVMCVILRVELR